MQEDRAMTSSNERALERKIDAAAWGILFLWVGIALLAQVSWGVGLVGAGVIALGAQVWRRYVGVKVDPFSVVVGALFAIVGVWNLFDVRVDIVPLLFIAAGIALLASTWRTRRPTGRRPAISGPAHPRV
jgi:hypothetical protein